MKTHEKPTVLCVDDEPLVSRSLYRLLSKEPYDVMIAETPRQALSYVRDYGVDLVIADQRMPDMSGLELLDEVRQVSPETAGLILTAYPESVLTDTVLRTSGPPLYTKPWDDDVLRAGIRELLKERGAKFPPTDERPPLAVLVPVDGRIDPELSLGSVLPWLIHDPVRIHLLQVVPHLGLHRDVYGYLEQTRARLQAEGVDAEWDVRMGDEAEQILHHARHTRADLIVLPPPSRKAPRFRRTLAERILDACDVPVLVGRTELRTWQGRRILVPLDGSRGAESALADAVRMARGSGSWMDLLGAFERPIQWGYGRYVPFPSPAQEWVPYLAEVSRMVELADVPASVHVREGQAAEELLGCARATGADLICLAADRGSWSSRVFGGMLRRVLAESPCPVFVRKAFREKS